MTVSPFWIFKRGCSAFTMRISTARSSPWAPVHMMVILSSGYPKRSLVLSKVPLFALIYPNCFEISMFVFIENPSKATFLPYFSDKVMICWRRLIKEAKVAVMTRPLAFLKISSKFSIITFSEREWFGSSAFVESESKSNILRFPISFNRS